MVRATNVPASKARRKKKLKLAKGFTGRNKNTNRVTSGVLKRSLANQFVSRKLRKRDFRKLWITRIGIAAKLNGTTYSRLISDFAKMNIALNRKMLSEIAIADPETFSSLIKSTQSN